MTRGFLGGILMGAVVSVGAAVAITALIGPPVPPRPEAAAVEVPPGSEFQERREDRSASVPAPLPQPEPGAAPTVAAPEPDTLAPMAGADTDPAAQPQTGAPEGQLAAPPAQGTRGRVEVSTDAPVLPSPQAALPAAPQAEDAVNAPPAPPPPSASTAAAESGQDEPAPQETDAATPGPAPVATAQTPVSEQQAQPVTETVGTDAQVAERAETPVEKPASDRTETAMSPQAPVTPDSADPEQIAQAPDPGVGSDGGDAETDAARPDPQPNEPADGRPSIGRPAQSLIGRDTAGDSRLTLMGEAAQNAVEPASDVPEATVSQPPIVANAAPFDNSEARPLMSIVLIDDGAFSSAVEALSSFPYPLSFAIDPSRDGAAEAAQRYRDAGFEVLALTDVPETAVAADVEVNMAALLAAMPAAVAVMEGTGSGLQSSRAISDQVTAYLRDSGHGLVMYPNGLDTARKLAEREGVPAATLFRDFDAKGQDASVIRRFLDQAAFKASQEEGGVIMVGRARPETVSALILWGLADRASRVALAPVSAVLRARAGMPAETGAGQ